jgi:hypothetical protein
MTMQQAPSRLSVLIVSLFAGAWVSAQAPVAPPTAASLINIRNVQATSVKSPEYSVSVSGMSTKRDGRQNWMMVSAEYDILPPWTDEVTFTFYVVLEAKAGDLKARSELKNMFTGTVTYMNVKRGRHMATMFLDPNTFERYGRPIAVSVVVNVEGQAAGGAANPTTQTAWWTTQTPIAIPLLRRDESPFRFVEIEAHNTIKL